MCSIQSLTMGVCRPRLSCLKIISYDVNPVYLTTMQCYAFSRNRKHHSDCKSFKGIIRKDNSTCKLNNNKSVIKIQGISHRELRRSSNWPYTFQRHSCEHDSRYLINQRHFHTCVRLLSRPLTDPENRGQSQDGVNFDTLGSWNNRIDMPILMEESIKKGKLIPRVAFHDISSSSLIGRRKTNEDRFVTKELIPGLHYFAIFDGHGGPFAVDYISSHLEDHLRYWTTKTTSLADVIEKSFLNINNMLCRHVNHYYIDTDTYSTGTTATVCLLRNSIELVVGHVGDSRAILCRNGEAIRLTKEDTPEDPVEAERIKQNDGQIVYNSLGLPQVNGRLAMTRSLGDVDLKKYGVSATPHIRSIEVSCHNVY
ncbi:protein phosphatase 1K, mitochondrial [Patella vulgata]|uniref:protein phosphatase 1K, mitochondrial n=1 Tax=Patella vulgata TaxID=6465 RepID=UPI0024A964B7|nr:protein phosphatase 1K, mitochondrial [Patella vulgata]